MNVNPYWAERATHYIIQSIDHKFDIQTNMMQYLDSMGYDHRDEDIKIDIAITKKLLENTSGIRTEEGKVKRILSNSEKIANTLQ